MRFSTVFVAMAAIATATITTAAPTPKSSNNQTLTILNYALSLEHLEAEFYKQGLAKFNESDFTNGGFNATVRDRFSDIGDQENTHVMALTSVIESMNGTAVPISYLGAASNLTGDLLTDAASITAVEARHASYLNELWGQYGAPYAFDTPLGPREVITIASNFISSCPHNITIKPFNQLTASLPAAGSNSSMVTTSFMGTGSNSTNSTYCQFLYGNSVSVSPRSECSLPMNATGYVYVLITKNKTPLTLEKDSSILAGPALLFNTISSQSNGTQTNGTQTS
ncbi:hypothetical protein BGZ89_012242 [Linnemannia elongata]|nr:hypothetical protein BGZ89_012242 [Linnemannia elongata]